MRIVVRPVNEPDKPADPTPPVSAPVPSPAALQSPAAPSAPVYDAPAAVVGEGADERRGDGADAEGGDDAQGVPGETGEKRRRRRRRRRKGRGEPGESGAAEGGEVAPGEPDGERPPRPDRPRPERPRPDRSRPERGGRQDRQRPEGKRPRRDSNHHAVEAVRSLAEMAQALLRIEGVEPLAMPRYLDLNLRVPIDGGNDIRHAASTAVEQILKRVREVREHEKALRPGAVFCYFHGTSSAEGTRPTEPRQVFEGYSSTGKPVFADFVTMAIERKDPGIDRLLAGEEVVLTRVLMGRVLRTQQLAEFGSESPVYRILGQVDAGLFKVLGAAGKCAFSFQLLRGTTLEGRIRLRLHVVGAVDPMDLADPAVMQIVSRCQRRLDTEALRLEGQSKEGAVDEESFVRPLLEDFARQLEHRSRSAARRTQHGLERSETGQRPTSRAYPDAGEASDDAILWDVDQGTIVVVAPKGRVHVFSPDGKHVTSVVMQGDAIGRRRNMGRWRLAEPEERGEFRIHVRRLVAAGEDQTTSDVPLVPPGASTE